MHVPVSVCITSSFKIDFGIVGNDYELDAYESKVIYTGHFESYVASHATLEQQQKMGFILASYDVHENRELRDAYLNQYGADLPVALEVTSWEAIANLVFEGAGIGYLPDYMGKKKELSMTKWALDLKMAQRNYEICTISPKGMSLRQVAKLFSPPSRKTEVLIVDSG